MLVASTAIYFWVNRSESEPSTDDPASTPTAPLPTREQTQSTIQPPGPLFGERLLFGYGTGDPANDLEKVGSLIANYRVLAKGMDARHFASNDSLAAALRGEQRIALVALPQNHPIFNDEGLIVDRWDTPLFFHLEAADDLSIYSAGPDKEMGTADDYRLEDGRTQQGKAEF